MGSSPYNPNRDADTKSANALLALADAMTTGSPTRFILEQEANGAREMLTATTLPADMDPSREAFEAVGFTFGDPVDGDPLFIHAALPDGWTREATGHSMHTSILDQLGRKRVGIFYKAAFYDRRADMGLVSVASYAVAPLWDDKATIILDDEWATREAVTEALEAYAAREEADADKWEATFPTRTPENVEQCKPHIAEKREKAARAREMATNLPTA